MPGATTNIREVPESGYEMTKFFEGYMPSMYTDSVGKRTIGYGFNADEPTVSRLLPRGVQLGLRELAPAEAESIYHTLYQQAVKDAFEFVGEPAFQKMSPRQFAIVTDMAYNMGKDRLAGFKKLRARIQEGDWQGAAREMQNSKWARQVGRRSRHHVEKFAQVQAIS